ncbi:hypothetical protein DASC09_024520 [Saccharomycopsis crataegensis]|uniref:Peptidase A1 domain-containing protein n=1 Tax=Saccharomycopsis crataegensis TaxID=43959 RepID=A0AAV5QK01_9ASCO|nr:hypothetical protein DASC09_024520 [Saccharomycopsis crataegensis]
MFSGHKTWLILVLCYYYYGLTMAATPELPFDWYSLEVSGKLLTKLNGPEMFLSSNEVIDEVFPITDMSISSTSFRANIDFDTADIWVNGTVPKSSSTSTKSSKFIEKLSTGEEISGTWYDEELTLMGLQVASVPIGMVSDSKILPASLGLGQENTGHSNIRSKLVQNGQAAVTSYSIVNEIGKYSGNIIFGTIDTAMYTGDLITFHSTGSNFTVPVSAISVNSKIIKGSSATAVFNRNKDMIYLSKNVITEIINESSINGTFDSKYGIYRVECEVSDKLTEKYLEFNLGGISITIPLSSLVYKISDSSACALGMIASSDADFVLGNSFLKYVYQFNDYANEIIKIGKAKSSSTITTSDYDNATTTFHSKQPVTTTYSEHSHPTSHISNTIHSTSHISNTIHSTVRNYDGYSNSSHSANVSMLDYVRKPKPKTFSTTQMFNSTISGHGAANRTATTSKAYKTSHYSSTNSHHNSNRLYNTTSHYTSTNNHASTNYYATSNHTTVAATTKVSSTVASGSRLTNDSETSSSSSTILVATTSLGQAVLNAGSRTLAAAGTTISGQQSSTTINSTRSITTPLGHSSMTSSIYDHTSATEGTTASIFTFANSDYSSIMSIISDNHAATIKGGVLATVLFCLINLL